MAAQYSNGQMKQCVARTCDLQSAEQKVFFQGEFADVTLMAPDLGQLAMLRGCRSRSVTLVDQACLAQVPRAVAMAM